MERRKTSYPRRQTATQPIEVDVVTTGKKILIQLGFRLDVSNATIILPVLLSWFHHLSRPGVCALHARLGEMTVVSGVVHQLCASPCSSSVCFVGQSRMRTHILCRKWRRAWWTIAGVEDTMMKRCWRRDRWSFLSTAFFGLLSRHPGETTISPIHCHCCQLGKLSVFCVSNDRLFTLCVCYPDD
jgi:hypothetical protein